ncbi:VWA domain-containing protein [Roseovarius autotrophicus]|uniref:VWA domain-containing protein n=1 Tax=Roseovarius autotrophicus TaxID=2824121 RepID=UPI001A00A523|nr:VWA domain-containing protein [Roseovarius autotrophicus]MBE0452372.1 VWA domain-containing protein [Roseovarius sp.]
MFDLAAPWALALLPLPWLLGRLLPPRAGGDGWLMVPGRIGADLARAARGAGGTRGGAVFPWLVWGLVVLALSGPRDLDPVRALKLSGRDLAVVFDLSGSMVRTDFYLDGTEISRLDAVRKVGAEFVRRRGGDRLALVLFGSEAYVAAPFTHDVEAVARRIEQAEIGLSGRATNISDGLGLALKRMEGSEAKSRVVILMSDGENNAGQTDPRGVAALAAGMGVRVHTIALGPKDIESAEAGERGVVDAATLRAIAEVSGGSYFRVRDMADLEAVGAALDRLEATESAGLAAEIHRDWWRWPAGAALLLTLAMLWRGPG